MSSAFELSLTGHPFVIPTDELIRNVRDWLRIHQVELISRPAPAWPGANAGRLGLGRYAYDTSDYLYEYHIPTGASNFSIFRGIMHKNDLPSGPSLLHNLIIKDEIGNIIDSDVAMLPPQPLVGLNGGADLYLVTVVDQRYFGNTLGNTLTAGSIWWLGSSVMNWSGLFTQLGFILTNGGGVYQNSTPGSVYGDPEIDSDLFAWDGPTGAIFDAALDSVGMQFVKDLTLGTGNPYVAIRYADQVAFRQTARQASLVKAGGTLWSSDTDPWLGAVLPNNVTVNFPEWVDGIGWVNAYGAGPNFRSHGGSGGRGSMYQVNVTAASLGSPYSSLPTGTYIQPAFCINTTAKAILSQLSSSATVTNSTAVTNLANQLAKDFYDRARGRGIIETYNGIVPFDGRSGCEISYTFWPTPMTRVWVRPLNDLCQETFHNIDGTKNGNFGGSGFLGFWKANDTAVIKITGGSANPYVGTRVVDNGNTPASWPTYETCTVIETNGGSLTTGNFYVCRLASVNPLSASGLPNTYTTTVTPIPTTTLTTNSTPVSGGSAGGVLYTDGTKLQASSNLEIAGGGNMPFIQAATNKWISFSIGSF